LGIRVVDLCRDVHLDADPVRDPTVAVPHRGDGDLVPERRPAAPVVQDRHRDRPLLCDRLADPACLVPIRPRAVQQVGVAPDHFLDRVPGGEREGVVDPDDR